MTVRTAASRRAASGSRSCASGALAADHPTPGRKAGRAPWSASVCARRMAANHSWACRLAPRPLNPDTPSRAAAVVGAARAASTMAESGSTRPGDRSRRWAIRRAPARVPGRWPGRGGYAPGGCRTCGARDQSAAGAARRASTAANSCRAHSSLPWLDQFRRQRVPQVHQDLDVQRGVAEPVVRQRAGGPVRGRVTLLQGQAEDVLDERAEPHPRVTEQPPGEFGVKQPLRPVSEVRQAGQVLRGRVQHRFGAGERRVQLRQVRAGHRVDQHGPGAPAAQLDQEGPVTVTETGRPFGVHRHRPVTRAQRADRLTERAGRRHQRWQAITRLQQRDGRWAFG